MNETAIEKKSSVSLKEKAQYSMVFGVIGVMLYFAGFPIFLLLFFGVLAFFISKVFSAEGRHETRRIFEFYLSANEILRENDRRWYGFEIQETIHRGESIARSMSTAPPLLHYALGALYQKLDDHSSAVKHLSHVVEESASSESAIIFPTKELREYVRMLRRIERAPAEAPLTSSAVRILERARKNKSKDLLEYSRSQLAKTVPQLPKAEKKLESVVDITYREIIETNGSKPNGDTPEPLSPDRLPDKPRRRGNHRDAKTEPQNPHTERKSISEVLHDIYDHNIQ